MEETGLAAGWLRVPTAEESPCALESSGDSDLELIGSVAIKVFGWSAEGLFPAKPAAVAGVPGGVKVVVWRLSTFALGLVDGRRALTSASTCESAAMVT